MCGLNNITPISRFEIYRPDVLNLFQVFKRDQKTAKDKCSARKARGKVNVKSLHCNPTHETLKRVNYTSDSYNFNAIPFPK